MDFDQSIWVHVEDTWRSSYNYEIEHYIKHCKKRRCLWIWCYKHFFRSHVLQDIVLLTFYLITKHMSFDLMLRSLRTTTWYCNHLQGQHTSMCTILPKNMTKQKCFHSKLVLNMRSNTWYEKVSMHHFCN